MQDVLVQNNIIRNSTAGVNVLARVAYNGGTLPTNPSSRIAVVNNLFQDVGKDPVSGAGGRVFQLLGDLRDMTVLNNTVTLAGTATHALVFDGAPQQRTTFVNNVLPTSEYGVFGSGRGAGTNAITYYMPDGTFVGNVIPGQPAAQYPANNFFPRSGMDVRTAIRSTVDTCSSFRTWLRSEAVPTTTGVNCESLLEWSRQGVTGGR